MRRWPRAVSRVLQRGVPRLPGRLAAADLVYLAEGRDRVVYAVRGRPDRVVKVARPGVDAERLLWWENRVLRRPDARAMPVPRLLGLQDTDHGRGQVVEAVLGGDGRPAPTLGALARAGRIDAGTVGALNGFVARVLATGLPAYEFRAQNLVFGSVAGRRAAGRMEAPSFWIIDGFGERQILPLRRLSRRLRERDLLAQLPRLARKIAALDWDPDARRFALRAAEALR